MKFVLFVVKWTLMFVGVITIYYASVLQFNYNGLTVKIIKQIINPTLHSNAALIYTNIANNLLDTNDIAMATVRRVKVAKDVSNDDVEQAMSSIAIERGIREVGMLPLSEQVELQLDTKQRFLKIYQYCSPTIAMQMVGYSDAFSAYLPCRIALVEDKNGDRWLYTLDMDMMIYGGKPLPPKLQKLALQVRETIYTIQDQAAVGNF